MANASQPKASSVTHLRTERSLRGILFATLCLSLLLPSCSADSAQQRAMGNRAKSPEHSAGQAAAGASGTGAVITIADAPTPQQPPLVSTRPATELLTDAGDGACVGIQSEAELQLLPSDIVWAIDTSGSMVSSFPAIQQALSALSTRVVEAGIDAHIVLLAGAGLCVPAPLGSGQCGLGDPLGGIIPGLIDPTVAPPRAPDTLDPNFLHLDVPFSSRMGMGVLIDNFPHYKHLLRENAHLQLVLTEDGSPPMGSGAVTDHIEGRASATGSPPWSPPAKPENYTWNGVLCTQGRARGNCMMAAGVPTTTLELVARTEGIIADLGNAGMPNMDPFAELLEKLAEAVIVSAAVSCEYQIPPAPTGETFDRDRVNVTSAGGSGTETTFPRADSAERCGEQTAWHYDSLDNPTRVILCPRACEAIQAVHGTVVKVGFGCQTILSPQ